MEICKGLYYNTTQALGVVIPFNRARCTVFCNIDKIIGLVCSNPINFAYVFSDACMNCFHNVFVLINCILLR